MIFPQNDASTFAKASSFVNTMEDKRWTGNIEYGDFQKTLRLSASPFRPP